MCRTRRTNAGGPYLSARSFSAGHSPGSGTQNSLITILLPSRIAGAKALRIRTQYLSGQSWKTYLKKYTAAPWTGCLLKKSCAWKLTRSTRSGGGRGAPETTPGRSCTMQVRLGKAAVRARAAVPWEPPMSTRVALAPRSAHG